MNPKDKIRIMISSRSNSPVFDPPVLLKEVREGLQEFIQQKVTLAGDEIFEVWICEEGSGRGVSSWWEESQAIRILGVPDCTLVKTDFGLYVVDKTLKVQILFLAGCRDVTATQSAITEMFQWLESAEESDDVVRRALARRRILEVIAAEAN